MHYANGQPAKVGDLIIHDDFGRQVAGILTGANAQSDTCNGNIHAVAQRSKSQLGLGNWLPLVGSNDNYYVTLSRCVAVDFDGLKTEIGSATTNFPMQTSTSKAVEIVPASPVIAQPEPTPQPACLPGYEIAGGTQQS